LTGAPIATRKPLLRCVLALQTFSWMQDDDPIAFSSQSDSFFFLCMEVTKDNSYYLICFCVSYLRPCTFYWPCCHFQMVSVSGAALRIERSYDSKRLVVLNSFPRTVSSSKVFLAALVLPFLFIFDTRGNYAFQRANSPLLFIPSFEAAAESRRNA
jgi:hypothetical protein